ncbi:UNVERIFIED_CONTAM: hypothetical protein Slati_3456600 [Sesamum latifolium]|uniref:Reverse transcriptase zinc-binding domain-containing protein n=1 Tax=Sesamum latifolium TaxID=2727402 RepID=A0AAW2UH09_9LAMI
MDFWIQWKIGDGRCVPILGQPWLHRPTTFQLQQTPVSLSADCKVAALITPADEWNEALILAEFCSDDADCILGIRLPGTNTRDELVWHYGKRGTFFVKSAYSLALELNEEGSRSQTGRSWNYILKSKSLPKVVLFAWRCANEALSTSENLRRGGMDVFTARRSWRTLFMSSSFVATLDWSGLCRGCRSKPCAALLIMWKLGSGVFMEDCRAGSGSFSFPYVGPCGGLAIAASRQKH